MVKRPFGPTREPVAIIGQGTWRMERDDRREAVRALRRGLDLGLTHVDTAELYGDGAVEEIVGEAIAGRRDEVFLASKVLPEHASFDGVQRACAASLRRLRTDWLDLYLLHWGGPHPLEDTFAAFERLREQGRIRFWGVSNFDERELEAAVRIAGAGVVACNQVYYQLGERGIEHEVLPACERHGIALVAYSPFGSGAFPAPRSRGGRALAEVAARRGATARQVALAWLCSRPSVFVIPKAARVEHVEENARAATLRLEEEDLRRLDAAFPRGPKPRTLPTL